MDHRPARRTNPTHPDGLQLIAVPALDAVIVGAGPNGLTAAAVLARAGLSVHVIEAAPTPGGGCRSAALTLPGYLHDVCAAVHALGAISPAFAELRLEDHGVQWARPPIALAHPLDGGRAALLHADLERTAHGLGRDAPRYERLVGPVVRGWDQLGPAVLGPLLRPPRHPIDLARFGLRALPSASIAQRHWFHTEEARALWAGSAAHACLPLSAPFTNAFALTLNAAAHLGGWPVAIGGSGRIVDALVAVITAAGGTIECGRSVRSVDELPPSRLVLFDLTVAQMLEIAGPRLTGMARRRMQRFRSGPGIFKVDYALDRPIPWSNPGCRQAATVHVGGSATEITAAEAEVAAGRHPDRPFVLVAQQHVADPNRVPDGKAALWAYCHVPAHSTVDMSAAIEAQIERFAPGFRDSVLARHRTDTRRLEAYNASYVGGDITGGAHDGLQLLARPRLSPHPYKLPWPGAFLCSASSAPGAGVHGMAGYHAARAALASLLRSSP